MLFSLLYYYYSTLTTVLVVLLLYVVGFFFINIISIPSISSAFYIIEIIIINKQKKKKLYLVLSYLYTKIFNEVLIEFGSLILKFIKWSRKIRIFQIFSKQFLKKNGRKIKITNFIIIHFYFHCHSLCIYVLHLSCRHVHFLEYIT